MITEMVLDLVTDGETMKREVGALWARVDSDASESLNKKEAREFVDEVSAALALEPVNESEFDEGFEYLDMDHSGEIEPEEM